MSVASLAHYEEIKFGHSVYEFKALGKQEANILLGRLDLVRVANGVDSSRVMLLNSDGLNDLDVVLNSTVPGANTESSIRFDPKTLELRTNGGVFQRSTTGRLHLRASLRQSYRSGEPLDTCLIVIRIVDAVNRPPKFRRAFYEVQVYENNAPDTFVLRVEATDELDWAANAQVTYHLASGNESAVSPFQIRSDTGEIFAKRGLDREQRDEYILNVMAVDKGPSRLTATVQVRVRVLSRQAEANYRPVFEQPVYNVSVPENTDFIKRPLILRVRAFDREISNKFVFIYSHFSMIL